MLIRFKIPALLTVVLTTTSLLLAHQASATTDVLLGTTTAGGIGIYYNTAGLEEPGNIAFMAAQFKFDLNGTGNGAAFQFDDTPLPGGAEG